jgi:Holliday junction DNA helicase RuvB
MLNRPQTLDDYVGQTKAKEIIKLTIGACLKTGKPLPHILLWGQPGLGKTTLAQVIANEINASFIHTTGANLKEDLIIGRTLTKCKGERNVLFIDEIHNLPQATEEKFYSLMEDNKIELNIIGEPIWYELPNITIIGATTKLGNLSKPFRDRFGIILELQPYTEEELSLVVFNTLYKNGIKVDAEICLQLALRSKGVPRIAISLANRFSDYILSKNILVPTINDLNNMLQLYEIEEDGLEKKDIELLRYLFVSGKPVGLSNLASALGYDRRTLEEVTEPFLVRKGLIARTTRGRQLTENGIKFLYRRKLVG